MKKEGTGEPQNPDIVFDAGVRMRELHFEVVPNPKVRFWGNTRRNSVWGSRRENLPDEVQEGVVYRNAGVRLRIVSEVVDSNEVDSDPASKTSLDRERVKTDLNENDLERAADTQRPEGKEEKE
jgi:hypothetical protein